MRLTLIHPAIGRRPNERYIRTWQMEPLPAAAIAGLTPKNVRLRFYDDRMETIPYDEPTDLVALSIETYTAKRCYQIASEYRRRGIPVVMGGFHATLAPDEVSEYAEAVVVGEAEVAWPKLIDDFRHGCLQKFYRATERPGLHQLRYDRGIFRGKTYLPVGLIETGRGCRFPCEFCAIQTFFERTHRARPVQEIIAEIAALKSEKNFFFFVDDNFAADMEFARELLTALIPMRIRWVTQMSINAAHDEEFLDLLKRSGCQGTLIGFESLDPQNLHAMGKRFNTMRGGFSVAMDNLRRHRLRTYATFVFGYEHDDANSFAAALDFALQHRVYIAAFNHLTPFPGTPLYQRLNNENRLTYPRWWMDNRYSYNRIPFRPAQLSADQLQALCLDTRRRFYAWRSIIGRGIDRVNRDNFFMFRNFFLLNWLHRQDVQQRNHYPLGDQTWTGTLIRAQ